MLLALGERKWQEYYIEQGQNINEVVEHWYTLPKVNGLSPADAAGTGREKWQEYFIDLGQNINEVVELSYHLPKINGFSPADAACTGREKMARILYRTGLEH